MQIETTSLAGNLSSVEWSALLEIWNSLGTDSTLAITRSCDGCESNGLVTFCGSLRKSVTRTGR